MNDSSIKIVQHNLNKDHLASLQLRDYCFANDIDIVLQQEPLINDGKVFAFEEFKQTVHGNAAGAAIIMLNEEISSIELGKFTNDYIVAVKISGHREQNDVTLVSGYFKYNMPTSGFTEKLPHPRV